MMRALLLFAFGLVIGALAAHTVGHTLRLRHAYTRGVMSVMQHHVAVLHKTVRSRQCPAHAADHDLTVMRTMANEIGPAFGNVGDAHFTDLAKRLKTSLGDAKLKASTPGCAALAASLQDIGQRCDACHREYR